MRKIRNAVILKGGSEALQSNIVIAGILTQAAEAAGIPAGAIQFVDSSDRQALTDLIKMNGLVDVVIPRGGAGLIQAVVQNAGRSKKFQLPAAVFPCRMDHVHLQDHIVIHKICQGSLICQIPPTFAAARKTYSGFSWAKNPSTAS